MKTGFKRFLFLSHALIGLVVVLIFVDESHYAPVDAPSERLSPSLPVVSYIPVSAGQAALSIPVFGELQPKWHVQIKSQVSGQVLRLAPEVEAGARVQFGDLLAEIDPTRYQAQVDQAALALAQAELELLQAKHQTRLAQADWRRSGMATEPSDLTLFKPQLAIAERAVQSAQSHYRLARKFLNDTSIRAPFSGVIVARTLSQGQIVMEGDILFDLVDDQSLTLEVALGEKQWSDLAPDWQGQRVDLLSSEKRPLARARLARGGHVMNTDSRQFSLFLEVASEQRSEARVGQFVHLALPGKSLSNVLNVPESAFTQDGTVWYIDAQDVLREYTPDIAHSIAGRVLVAAPSPMPATHVWRIATRPLSFFLAGKPVAPSQVTQ